MDSATVWATIGGMADSCRLLQARHCEIPAFAGMVYLCTGKLRTDLTMLSPAVMRFLPSQEWSTCVREIADGFDNVVARRHEIPAFAGMVYLCTGNCGRILALLSPVAMRFLLSQEWFTCVREFVDGFDNVAVRRYEIPAFAGMGCLGLWFVAIFGEWN